MATGPAQTDTYTYEIIYVIMDMMIQKCIRKSYPTLGLLWTTGPLVSLQVELCPVLIAADHYYSFRIFAESQRREHKLFHGRERRTLIGFCTNRRSIYKYVLNDLKRYSSLFPFISRKTYYFIR